MPQHFDVTKLRNVDITGEMKIDGNEVETAVLLGTGEFVDLNGEADALILDADADTTISAPTDDQIDFELKSVDHVVMKAAAIADAGAITNIVEIAATSPVDTTGTNTHNALNIDLEIGNATGGTNEVRGIAIDNITGDAQVVATGILLGTGFDIGLDMAGTKLELDADNDTSIIASTDDQIDIEIAGALDFRLTANTLTALSGSKLATDLIDEVTADTGVTIDSVLNKDGFTNARRQTQALTATGAITVGRHGLCTLAHATVVIASTLAAPTAGDDLIIMNTSASGTVAHTVKAAAGVTFDGTNNTLTLDAAEECVHLVAVSATRWKIMENIGSVGLSST